MKLSSVLFVAAAGIAVSLGTFGSRGAADEVRTRATYYANGQIDTEWEVNDGRREGACSRFYSDGSRLAEGSYAAGKMEGEWTFWRRDGSVDTERSGSYAAGLKVGG